MYFLHTEKCRGDGFSCYILYPVVSNQWCGHCWEWQSRFHWLKFCNGRIVKQFYCGELVKLTSSRDLVVRKINKLTKCLISFMKLPLTGLCINMYKFIQNRLLEFSACSMKHLQIGKKLIRNFKTGTWRRDCDELMSILVWQPWHHSSSCSHWEVIWTLEPDDMD